MNQEHCGYYGTCKNRAYREVYPSYITKKRGWNYLCRKHYYQEQKRLKGKLPWSTVALKDGEIDYIRNVPKNYYENLERPKKSIEEKQKLIKRLKKRSEDINQYVANGGKMFTWKDLGWRKRK